MTLTAFSLPVLADDLDPFQLETTHWMSFERYKDKTKHGALPTTEETAPTEAPPTVTAPTAPTPPAQPKTPVAALPTRPLNLPLMPGLNKGFDVHVSSTVDDNKTPTAKITNLDTTPTIELPQNNWQAPAEAVRQIATNKHSDDDEDKPTTLDVRPSFLPNARVRPAPSPEYKSNHGRATPQAIAAAVEEPKKSPTQLAQCAAVDAYKKKQLEAIQGDRQTLMALQAAIAQLGLQKQLDFIPGTNGSVSPQANNTGLKMDLPISTPTVIK